MGFDVDEMGADLSRDRVYRYRLWRRWDDGDEMTFIGVNPSTADETTNDQTIKKCIGLAKRHDCAAIQMLNLFALRETNPSVMKEHPKPIGPRNKSVLVKFASSAKIVVACWGVHGTHLSRDEEVVKLLESEGVELMCFGLTKKGFPKHPVMLAYSTELVPYES